MDRFFQAAGLAVAAAGVGLSFYGIWKSSHHPTPHEPYLEPGDQWLLLGDSIAEGLQLPLNNLSNQYGTVMSSLWKRGTTIPYWVQHLQESDAAYKAIAVSLGSNDARLDMSTESYQRAADEFVGLLQSRNAPVLWIIPPSFRLDAFTQKQAEFAEILRDRGVLPLQLRGSQPSVAYDPEHLHLTPDGYRTLAAQVFGALTEDLGVVLEKERQDRLWRGDVVALGEDPHDLRKRDGAMERALATRHQAAPCRGQPDIFSEQPRDATCIGFSKKVGRNDLDIKIRPTRLTPHGSHKSVVALLCAFFQEQALV